MPEWALERVLERIKRQFAQSIRGDMPKIKIVAAPLQFTEDVKPNENLSYPYFAKKATELFNRLKQHRFSDQKEVHYFQPVQTSASKNS